MTSLLLFLLSGLVRWVPTELEVMLFAGAVVAAALRDLSVLSFPLPQNARQVPREVFQRGLSRAALQFGFEMGTGARTHMTSTAPYLAALGILLLADRIEIAVLVGVSFGLGRSLMAAARYASAQGDWWDEELRTELHWLVPAATACVGWSFVVLSIRGPS